MFQKFLAKYGLATHLALLAAAPLALTPILDAASLSSVIMWLSALAVLWFVVEPSVISGDTSLSSARERVRREVICDPFFWFLCAVLIFAAYRMFNTGIALKYDPEAVVWYVGKPAWGGGPACVTGAGFPDFAFLVALSVVAIGIRHGIGLMARAAFGVTGSFIAGLGGIAAVALACFEVKPFVDWMQPSFVNAPAWTSCFGIWLVIGLLCSVQGEVRKWGFARFALVFGVAGNAGVLLFFAHTYLVIAWFSVAFVLWMFSLVYLSRAGNGGAVARNLSIGVLGVAIPIWVFMMFVNEETRLAKYDAINLAVSFPDVYKQASETLSRISREIWRANPWFGIGDGAYPLHLSFIADKADWSVIPAHVKSAYNSYWTLIAERGIIGCLLPVVGLGMLLTTYVTRLVKSFIYLRTKEGADIFPFAVPPIAWSALVLLVIPVLEGLAAPVFSNKSLFLTVLTALSLSAAAFPKAKNKTSLESK